MERNANHTENYHQKSVLEFHVCRYPIHCFSAGALLFPAAGVKIEKQAKKFNFAGEEPARKRREAKPIETSVFYQYFTRIQNSTDIDFISAFYSENEIEMGIHEVITHTVVFHEPGIHLHHPSSAGVKNEKETKILVVEDNRELLDTATNIIEHHLVDPNFSVDVLASELNLSRSSLHRKLKALTNQSATEFVKFVRINKSIKLIEGGETNIDEICFKVGFNSHSYYSMCFRKQLGQTPSDYISKIKRGSRVAN